MRARPAVLTQRDWPRSLCALPHTWLPCLELMRGAPRAPGRRHGLCTVAFRGARDPHPARRWHLLRLQAGRPTSSRGTPEKRRSHVGASATRFATSQEPLGVPQRHAPPMTRERFIPSPRRPDGARKGALGRDTSHGSSRRLQHSPLWGFGK